MPAKTVTITNLALVASQTSGRRVHLGLAQDEIVARAGRRPSGKANISTAVISLIENGGQERYTVHTMEALRSALEWPADWLERIQDRGEDLIQWTGDSTGPAGPADGGDELAAIRQRLDLVLDVAESLVQGQQEMMARLRDLAGAKDADGDRDAALAHRAASQ